MCIYIYINISIDMYIYIYIYIIYIIVYAMYISPDNHLEHQIFSKILKPVLRTLKKNILRTSNDVLSVHLEH